MCYNFEKKNIIWKEGKTGKKKVVTDVINLLLLESVDVRKRWANYFDVLLNVEGVREANIVALGGGARMAMFEAIFVAEITMEKVQEAGEVIPASESLVWTAWRLCLKRSGVTTVERLVRLLNQYFVSGVMHALFRCTMAKEIQINAATPEVPVCWLFSVNCAGECLSTGLETKQMVRLAKKSVASGVVKGVPMRFFKRDKTVTSTLQ